MLFKKVARDLLLANAAVFLIVGTVFSLAVYIHVINNLEGEQRNRLLTLTQAVVGSADISDVDDPNDDDEGEDVSVPEILRTGKQAFPVKGMSLQWYDTNGHLVTQNGSLVLSEPFSPKSNFQRQDSPHSLLLTTPVVQENKLKGYLRAGISLADFDRYRKHLLFALLSGVTLFLVVATIGVIWLVRQSLKRLQETIEKLKQFTADASHELRGPLMAVKTNAAVALRHEDGMRDKDREKFGVILDATDQMIRTTTDLLRLAESEQISPLERSSMNLSQVLVTIASEMSAAALSKSIQLETNLAEDIIIVAREEDAKSLFANVVENAIQYTNPGGKVTVCASKQGKRATIKVVDNGIGIKSEELPKIFDRFWRSDKARSYRTGGNGLGLAIVRAILDRYDGNISVTSQPGEGTTFVITLPAV